MSGVSTSNFTGTVSPALPYKTQAERAIHQLVQVVKYFKSQGLLERAEVDVAWERPKRTPDDSTSAVHRVDLVTFRWLPGEGVAVGAGGKKVNLIFRPREGEPWEQLENLSRLDYVALFLRNIERLFDACVARRDEVVAALDDANSQAEAFLTPRTAPPRDDQDLVQGRNALEP